MHPKFVKINYPSKLHKNDMIKISTSKIQLTKLNMTIYDIVDYFEQNIFLIIKMTEEKIKTKVQLRDIINLHNNTGIKDISQIKSMITKIKSKKDILHQSKLPNIKLIKTKDNDRVLFDGHHSMLAYMSLNLKYLHEIPHLIIENEHGYVLDKDILIFFGPHAGELTESTWRDYVLNWQAPKEKQLCKRIQNNMGELFDSLRSLITM
jgi:hypothetical protein